MPDPDPSPAPTTTPEFWRELVAKDEFWFRVTSDSMTPTLLPGDQVLIRPLDRPAARGQVLVFLHEGRLVVHRCLGPGRFRGDSRIVLDPPISPAQIIGIATACRRGEQEWQLASSPPWRTRCARFRLRLRRLGRWFYRLLARATRPLRR